MSLFGGLWVGGFFILFLECTTKCTEYVHVHSIIPMYLYIHTYVREQSLDLRYHICAYPYRGETRESER